MFTHYVFTAPKTVLALEGTVHTLAIPTRIKRTICTLVEQINACVSASDEAYFYDDAEGGFNYFCAAEEGFVKLRTILAFTSISSELQEIILAATKF